MTYARTFNGLGATGDRFSIGQQITARFTPHGVNASNQVATFAALSTAMARTGVFGAPTYNGWGAGDNAGLVVFKASTNTDEFTPKQVANKMPAVIDDVTHTLGAPRLTFVSIVHPTPSGPAVASDTSALVAPDTSAYAPTTQSGAAAEEVGFFSRKVGGIPVWAIGGGVLALGAGLVTVAMVMRKKKAPAALAANRRGA